jgi:tetratricopeptide (TPR) repeat protein
MDERLRELLILGREHYERREFDRAENALRQVLERTDRYADVYNMLAVILHERGDFAGAEAYFERAIELNPSYTEALLNLAVTYNELGKYEAARRVYADVQRGGGAGSATLDPFVKGKIANMHAEVAQAYADAGCRPEAIDELSRAVALCPTFADLHTKLGNLYREGGELARARHEYEAARQANARYVPARIMLGVTLLALEDADAAEAEWRGALAIEPENKSAAMYLRMLEKRRRDGARPPRAVVAAGGAAPARAAAEPTPPGAAASSADVPPPAARAHRRG